MEKLVFVVFLTCSSLTSRITSSREYTSNFSSNSFWSGTLSSSLRFDYFRSTFVSTTSAILDASVDTYRFIGGITKGLAGSSKGLVTRPSNYFIILIITVLWLVIYEVLVLEIESVRGVCCPFFVHKCSFPLLQSHPDLVVILVFGNALCCLFVLGAFGCFAFFMSTKSA